MWITLMVNGIHPELLYNILMGLLRKVMWTRTKFGAFIPSPYEHNLSSNPTKSLVK